MGKMRFMVEIADDIQPELTSLAHYYIIRELLLGNDVFPPYSRLEFSLINMQSVPMDSHGEHGMAYSQRIKCYDCNTELDEQSYWTHPCVLPSRTPTVDQSEKPSITCTCDMGNGVDPKLHKQSCFVFLSRHMFKHNNYAVFSNYKPSKEDLASLCADTPTDGQDKNIQSEQHAADTQCSY